MEKTEPKSAETSDAEITNEPWDVGWGGGQYVQVPARV